MRATGTVASILVLVALSACSALVTPDPSRLGGTVDGGAFDAFVPEGVDADIRPPDAFREQFDVFVPEGVDADIRPPDAWAPLEPDAYSPPTCVEGSRCDGEVAVVCAGGVEARQDCAAEGLVCEAAVCRPMRCMPGTAFCSADGTGLVTCNPDGSGLTFSTCPAGCERGATVCNGGGSCEGYPEIGLGDTESFDLCAAAGTRSFARTDACGADGLSDSNDEIFVLRLTEPADVEVDLRDVDPRVGVDTIVYLRRGCEDPASQIACSDDIPCTDSDITLGCSRGVQVRQSRFSARLPAGTYYIVADAFRYSGFDCGDVELRVNAR